MTMVIRYPQTSYIICFLTPFFIRCGGATAGGIHDGAMHLWLEDDGRALGGRDFH